MSAKKILKEEYNRLKKTFEKILSPKNKEQRPQLVVQPYRTKKYLRDE